MGNSKDCVTYQKTLENCEAAADDDGSFSVDCLAKGGNGKSTYFRLT